MFDGLCPNLFHLPWHWKIFAKINIKVFIFLDVRLNKFGVIPILADILSDAQKEKVKRII